MNITGFLLWLIVGGVSMQFWIKFVPGNQFTATNPTGHGIAMGVLSILNSVVYLGEAFLSYKSYSKYGDRQLPKVNF